MSELDGFEINRGVIVIAATNRIDILDKAILRPGRFDRKVYIPLPDIVSREAILPTKSTPLGILLPNLAYLSGFCKNSTILLLLPLFLLYQLHL